MTALLRWAWPLRQLVGAFTWLLPIASFAQQHTPSPVMPTLREAGVPFYRNFDPKEYRNNAQNWAVVQAPNGLIYVANSGVVLEYDGVVWTPIGLGSNASLNVRSLALDSRGRVFVGAQGEFGYLAPDTLGATQFYSLKAKLPAECRDFANVWQMAASQDAVYLNTGNYIIRWGEKGVQFWKAQSPDGYHTMFVVNNVPYVREWNIGLQRLVAEQLELVPGGEQFANERVDAMVPAGKRAALVASRKFGLMRLQGNELMPLQAEVNQLLDTSQVYCGTALVDGTYAFGTLRGGVVQVDGSGHILQLVNKQLGLLDDKVHAAYQDRQGSLWLALDRGIARVELPAAFTQFGPAEGLEGTVFDVHRYEGWLYAATGLGLFRLGPPLHPTGVAHWEPVSGISSQAWDLAEVEGELLAATTQGVLVVQGLKATPVAGYDKPVPAYVLHAADRLYVGQEDGLCVLGKIGKQWTKQGNVIGLDQPVRWITLAPDSTLWVGNTVQGMLRLNFRQGPLPTLQLLDVAAGLPTLDGNTAYRIGQELVVATRQGLFTYDEALKRFKRYFGLGEELADGREIKFVAPSADGSVWIYSYSAAENYRLHHAIPLVDSSFGLERTLMPRVVNRFTLHCLYAPGDSLLWMGGDEGLLRYDSRVFKPYTQVFRTAVRAVVANDSLPLFLGNLSDSLAKDPIRFHPTIKYDQHNIRFDCAALSYDEAKANAYQYWLEPFEQGWSAWTGNSSKAYTNLPEGEYTFHARARNVYNLAGPEAVFAFTVRPPWYRTWWAFLLYVALATGGVYALLRWRLARLEQEKKELEKKVAERTAEVVSQKDEIQRGANELKSKNAELENAYEEITAINENLNEAYKDIETKNKDITDSIQYAKRIQEAFLPATEELRAVLPEVFVLFKPRDIVSGDFYWYTKQGETLYIAGVDCTGHGVPGAIMSMLGNSLLNQILSERGAIPPGQVLDELDQKVKVTLKQLNPNSRTKDGMEVALCALDVSQRKLTFAGAKRPLLHIHAGQMEELRGDKVPIGGTQYEVLEHGFTNHTISYAAGDAVYTFSDGFGDQFGGDKGKKFMVSRLKELIMEGHTLPMEEQAERLNTQVEAWKGDREQVDDILVIGIRLR